MLPKSLRASVVTERPIKLSALLALALLSGAKPVAAQAVVDATFSLQTGAEGADPGAGALVWQRARTRATLGAEWLLDDAKREAVGLSMLVELERSGSFGAEVRYRRWLNDWLGAYAAVTTILQPESLLGLSGGATGLVDMGGGAAVFAELSLSAFPLGTDLSHGESVLLWASLGFGVRLRF